MAKNDRILFDQVLGESARAADVSPLEHFQHFSVAQVLKDYDLSPDEINLGIVDGRDDGGVDAWYTFIDGELVADRDDIPHKRVLSRIELLILSCKHHDTFKLEPVVNLHTATTELLDLSRDEDDLAKRYNDNLLNARELFKEALVRTTHSNPRLKITILYLSRGDSSIVGSAIAARTQATVDALHELFSECDAAFAFVGSAELLKAYRKLRDFSAVMTFSEGPLSRGPSNYFGLVTLREYLKFAIDAASGELRRYLFESNVRDYMGANFVNDSIANTIESGVDATEEDFWWLNNGVTVLSTRATVRGKELHLENVQIVNGLQTTEVIYRCRQALLQNNDRRSVLVKILVTDDKALADRIIRATNNQTTVEAASLRATDKIQRDIEDLLLTHGWFYDRRKNYYLNQGKPSDRIVSLTYMTWAVLATRFTESDKGNRARPEYMQDDKQYRRLFDENIDINVYLYALEICKTMEHTMSTALNRSSGYISLWRFFYAAMAVFDLTTGRQQPTDAQLHLIADGAIDGNYIQSLERIIRDTRRRFLAGNQSAKRLHRNVPFANLVRKKLLEQRA